jgi:hypothetical protein
MFWAGEHVLMWSLFYIWIFAASSPFFTAPPVVHSLA